MVISQQNQGLMPVQSIEQAVAQYEVMVQFISKILKRDVDYGKIPGTNTDCLFQPGAQKLSRFFGLHPIFTIVEEIKDWSGADHDGEPFFSFTIRCDLYRNGEVMGSCIANCNSFEKKYRYRYLYPNQVTLEDKTRGVETVKSGKTGEYKVWRVPSPDIHDQVNTVLKMCEKRAYVGATLNATSASEFYTQDLEDHAEDSTLKQEPQAAKQTAKPVEEVRAEKPTGETDTRAAMPGVLNSLRQVYAKRGETPPADMESWTQEFAKNQLMSLSAKGAN